jgi:hypothetical protein
MDAEQKGKGWLAKVKEEAQLLLVLWGKSCASGCHGLIANS